MVGKSVESDATEDRDRDPRGAKSEVGNCRRGEEPLCGN